MTVPIEKMQTLCDLIAEQEISMDDIASVYLEYSDSPELSEYPLNSAQPLHSYYNNFQHIWLNLALKNVVELLNRPDGIDLPETLKVKDLDMKYILTDNRRLFLYDSENENDNVGQFENIVYIDETPIVFRTTLETKWRRHNKQALGRYVNPSKYEPKIHYVAKLLDKQEIGQIILVPSDTFEKHNRWKMVREFRPNGGLLAQMPYKADEFKELVEQTVERYGLEIARAG